MAAKSETTAARRLLHCVPMRDSRRGYRELQVWQKSMDLVMIVNEVSGAFPEDERFGLRSQIRRAATSVPCNVAEGHCRRTTGAYAHHVTIALGSQGEIETCAQIAIRLNYISAEAAARIETACAEVGRMLSGLYAALERKQLAGPLKPIAP